MITRRPRRLDRRLLALAAGLVVVAGISALWSWRWSWPAGAPWPATIYTSAADSGDRPAPLQLARRFEVGPDASARVQIARIGSMAVSPGSTLVLSETRSSRHRVRLDRGAVRVRLWAPPGHFAFQTPAGSVIDLGCIFDLSVDGQGTTRVRVDTGWVQLANGSGEALVPAGASERHGRRVQTRRADLRRRRAGLRGGGTGDKSAVGRYDARPLDRRDRRNRAAARRHHVARLADVQPAAAKRPLLERAVRLVPPPPGVSVDAIVAGDSSQLWQVQRARSAAAEELVAELAGRPSQPALTKSVNKSLLLASFEPERGNDDDARHAVISMPAAGAFRSHAG